jgi:hypothetical protein
LGRVLALKRRGHGALTRSTESGDTGTMLWNGASSGTKCSDACPRSCR